VALPRRRGAGRSCYVGLELALWLRRLKCKVTSSPTQPPPASRPSMRPPPPSWRLFSLPTRPLSRMPTACTSRCVALGTSTTKVRLGCMRAHDPPLPCRGRAVAPPCLCSTAIPCPCVGVCAWSLAFCGCNILHVCVAMSQAVVGTVSVCRGVCRVGGGVARDQWCRGPRSCCVVWAGWTWRPQRW
jgi:hypothetical protein